MGHRIVKGTAYFETFSEARSIAAKVGGRVVEYERGFAVQYRVSGPYYPENEETTSLSIPLGGGLYSDRSSAYYDGPLSRGARWR